MGEAMNRRDIGWSAACTWQRAVTYREHQSTSYVNGQDYVQKEGSWLNDVRPHLAIYLLAALDGPERAPSRMVAYMAERGITQEGAWLPTDEAWQRLKNMREFHYVLAYRHGAAVWRMMLTGLVRLEDDGRLTLATLGCVDVQSNVNGMLYDEAVKRRERLAALMGEA